MKKALEADDVDAIKTASEHAATVSQKMGRRCTPRPRPRAGARVTAAGGAARKPAGQDDDVVDAEIVDEGEGGAA